MRGNDKSFSRKRRIFEISDNTGPDISSFETQTLQNETLSLTSNGLA